MGQDVAEEFYISFVSREDLRKLPVNNKQKAAYLNMLEKWKLKA